MRALYYYTAFAMRQFYENKANLLLYSIFPLAFCVFAGFVPRGLNSLQSEFIPAVIIFTALAGALLGLPGTLVEAREAGIFLKYRAVGIKLPSIIALQMIFPVIALSAATAVIIPICLHVFNALEPVNWAAFIGSCFAAIFSCLGIGVLIGMVTKGYTALIISQIVFMTSVLVGGIMVPARVLPPLVEKIGMFLPVPYAMSLFQGAAYREETAMPALVAGLILITGGALALLLAVYLLDCNTSGEHSKKGSLPLSLFSLTPYLVGFMWTLFR